MQTIRARALTIVTALSIVSPCAAQELSPASRETMEPAVRIEDGGRTWSVHRDARDRQRVSIAIDDGPVFHARIDRHAIVRVAAGVDPSALFHEIGVLPVREIAPSIGAWRVIDRGSLDGLDLAARLAPYRGAWLLDAIPDWIFDHRARAITVPPNDERYAGQWYFDRIGIEGAWALSSGDPSVTIVVVDSGCDLEHPDLAANMDGGRDVIDGDDDPTPSVAGGEHGTACAGLAAARADNVIGIAGACPECRIRCVRLLDGPSTPVPVSADLDAFQFALDVDAAVVSNSWGFNEPTPVPATMRAILETLADEGRGGLGAIVLFASGNDDRELFDYEIEAVRGVITVGAVNNFDEATAFSNRGECVDIVAPTGTLTTDISGPGGADPGDYTSNFGGTSSSCPIAAGVVGLLVSAAPDRSAEELTEALVSTARPSIFATPDENGHDLVYGYGRIDPTAALRSALGIVDPPDAGTARPDAGSTDAGGPVPPGGCGCSTPSRGSHGAPLAALAIVFWLRSRLRMRRSHA
jgi:serine protease